MSQEILLKLEFDKALRAYRKLLQNAPKPTASNRELDEHHNSVLLAKAQLDKVLQQAIDYKG